MTTPTLVATIVGAIVFHAATPSPAAAQGIAEACASVAKDEANALAVQGDGTVFVATRSRVIVFGPKARGNAEPTRELAPASALAEALRNLGCATRSSAAPRRTDPERILAGAAFQGMALAYGQLDIFGQTRMMVFPRDASGDAAPLRQTESQAFRDEIGGPLAFAVGADRTLYVLVEESLQNHATGPCLEVVRIFAPGRDPSAGPTRTVRSPLGSDASCTADLVVDSRGRLYLVDAKGTLAVSEPHAVATFKTIQPFAKPPASSPRLALDSGGRLYVAGGGTVRIVAGATTETPSFETLTGPATALERVIGLATDDLERLYVLDCHGSIGAVRIFGSSSRDNARPLAAIAGDATGLHCASQST